MGSMNVSSCRCCMFVSCVHPVAVLNAALCMTCSLLMLVEDARSDHVEYASSRASSMWSGKSLQLLCILPFGILCLSAISMMFVNIMLAVCVCVGGYGRLSESGLCLP